MRLYIEQLPYDLLSAVRLVGPNQGHSQGA